MKKHTSQSHKQRRGQFFTKNASTLLKDFGHWVRGRRVVDPFCGECDLLDWSKENGALECVGYDLEPRSESTNQRDTLLNPPSYDSDILIVSNPPYLRSNKNRDKAVYEKWGFDDLYKCAIASFSKVDEGILILPSNFLSESVATFRNRFFREFTIELAHYYQYPVFPEATTGIVVIKYRCDEFSTSRRFPLRLFTNEMESEEVDVEIHYEDGWLFGSDFFRYIAGPRKYRIQKWTGSEEGYLSNLVLGLLDKGRYRPGLTYNGETPIIPSRGAFTTTQLVLPFPLSESVQQRVVQRFNHILTQYREHYRGLFLANYLGARQKILNVRWAYALVEKVIDESLKY